MKTMLMTVNLLAGVCIDLISQMIVSINQEIIQEFMQTWHLVYFHLNYYSQNVTDKGALNPAKLNEGR